MTMKQAQHAQNVVSAFQAKLPASTVDEISDVHFAELALLIESAISAAVLQEMEKTADKIDVLAHEVRHFAEHFDD
ncbi:MAG: phosphatase [Neptuniibacter caesariensis]|uniref:Phosphatase n=1 Tax=Neptuniibacter caesariensis TaxID=207954 RepID=A0A2G6JKR4_NEPCE|nr:MAG: phosphatase [Neptuniibacter caesariensis]